MSMGLVKAGNGQKPILCFDVALIEEAQCREEIEAMGSEMFLELGCVNLQKRQRTHRRGRPACMTKHDNSTFLLVHYYVPNVIQEQSICVTNVKQQLEQIKFPFSVAGNVNCALSVAHSLGRSQDRLIIVMIK